MTLEETQARLLFYFLKSKNILTDRVTYSEVAHLFDLPRNRFTPDSAKDLVKRLRPHINMFVTIALEARGFTFYFPQAEKTSDPACEVFDFWRETVPGKSSARKTKKRLSKIRTRLKEFSVDELKKAIESISESSWHNGDNPNNQTYNDILFLCRDVETIERFLSKHKPTPKRRSFSEV